MQLPEDALGHDSDGMEVDEVYSLSGGAGSTSTETSTSSSTEGSGTVARERQSRARRLQERRAGMLHGKTRATTGTKASGAADM